MPSLKEHDGTKHDGAVNESRRTVLQKIGLGAVIGAIAGFAVQTIRSLVPNVLYEPPRRFKVGYPSDLPEGMTFLDEKRLYIFREGKSYYAISGTCTHLGCTVRYSKFQKPKVVEIDGQNVEMPFQFQCPCHGSKFYGDGTQYEGPAPRPLHWYRLEVAPDDGQLVVNMNDEVDRNYRLTV